ncbi:hypothetical protein D3C72_1669060 [compost metagenome]
MFGVDKGAGAAQLLHLGHYLQRQRGLARRFRTIDLHHAAARQAADAQRDIEPQRAGGHHLDVLFDLAIAQTHDRALAELLLDLGERGGKRLLLLGAHAGTCLLVVHGRP